MRSYSAARDPAVDAGVTVAVGRQLVAVCRQLVAVRAALVGVGGRLVAIGARLVLIRRGLVAIGARLVAVDACGGAGVGVQPRRLGVVRRPAAPRPGVPGLRAGDAPRPPPRRPGARGRAPARRAAKPKPPWRAASAASSISVQAEQVHERQAGDVEQHVAALALQAAQCVLEAGRLDGVQLPYQADANAAVRLVVLGEGELGAFTHRSHLSPTCRCDDVTPAAWHPGSHARGRFAQRPTRVRPTPCRSGCKRP